MNILVTVPFTDCQKTALVTAASGNDICFCKKESLKPDELKKAEIIIGNLPPDMLGEASSLRWIQLNSAGAAAYCAPGILPPDVILTSAVGAYGPSVSENLLAYTLVMIKKLCRYANLQRDHRWQDEGRVLSLARITVLVYGTGDIGRCYAEKMKALGSRVIGVRRSGHDCPSGFEEVFTIPEADAILPIADVVAIALPGTAQTSEMFDEKRLHLMKRGAYLLNVGRGNIVNSSALESALREGWLGGAALDVTDPEPLPPEHPLWNAPGLLVTPHIAGGFHMDETLDNICDICSENLRRYLAHLPLRNVVDRALQY